MYIYVYTYVYMYIYYILAVTRAGHVDIKSKMFESEARVLIGWLASTL